MHHESKRLVKGTNFKLIPDNEVFKLHRLRGREDLVGLSVHASDVQRVSLWEDVVASWPTTSSSLATKQMKSQLVVTAAIPCLALRGALTLRSGIVKGSLSQRMVAGG